MLSFHPKFREHESGVACSFTSCYKEKDHLQQTGVCGAGSVVGEGWGRRRERAEEREKGKMNVIQRVLKVPKSSGP